MLHLHDAALRLRGFPAAAIEPAAEQILSRDRHTRVRLQIYLFPAPAGRWCGLATVSVDFWTDQVRMEMEYDCGAFLGRPDPVILLDACAGWITHLWGGPGHFVRFGLLELNTYLNPMTRHN